MKVSFRSSLHLMLIAVALGLGACEKKDPTLTQGYVEGEFVYVASPGGGQLEVLSVEKGNRVVRDSPLFALNDIVEKSARDEAARRVAQAEANLEDAKMGQRPTEIRAIEAQLNEAEAAATLSEQDLKRQAKLAKSGAIAQRDLDSARAQEERDRQRVAQLRANLQTARLGARTDQIAAAEQTLLAQKAILAGAEWNLSQKTQRAPLAGLVVDTLYRKGDWVNAGAPVVVLLPPANVKVRTYVPQEVLGRVELGSRADVYVDGVKQPYEGKVNYIAPRAEFTPPVIYSQKMREKFVFLVELTFAPEVAVKLHPGQPVDVRIALR